MVTKNAAHTVHFKCFIKYVSINYCIHIKGGYVKVSCLKICNTQNLQWCSLFFIPLFKSNIQTSRLRKNARAHKRLISNSVLEGYTLKGAEGNNR